MTHARWTGSLLLPLALGACVPAAPGPSGPAAVPAPGTVTYTCDGGRTLAVTYGRQGEDDIITINPTGAGTRR